MPKFNFLINEKIDRVKWNNFVYNHPLGTIFQTSWIYDIYNLTVNNNAGAIVLEDENKNIIALVVYALISEGGIKTYFSKRSIISGGPLSLNNNISYMEMLLNKYNSVVRKEGAIYSEVRNLNDVKPLHTAFINSKFNYKEHLGVHVDLTKPEEELWMNVQKQRASNIRRGIKKGVITKDINIANDMDAAYAMIKDTYERIQLPHPPKELFLNAAEILQDKIKFWGAYLDGKLIGCRVYFIYKNLMYDWYAATNRDYSSFIPGDVLPWNAMMWGKENGIKVYDFAGGGDPKKEYTVRDYKLKFGAVPIELGRYLRIHKPLLYKLGTIAIKYYKYFR